MSGDLNSKYFMTFLKLLFGRGLLRAFASVLGEVDLWHQVVRRKGVTSYINLKFEALYIIGEERS